MTTKTFPIPVYVSDSANQEEPEVLGVPDTVASFRMPEYSGNADKSSAAACCRFFREITHLMGDGTSVLCKSFSGLSSEAVAFIRDMLGEGEVSIRVRTKGTIYDEIRIRESRFVGVWLVRFLKQGRSVAEHLEVAPIPDCVRDALNAIRQKELFAVAVPKEAMNSPSVLTELKERLKNFDGNTISAPIILSSLPMTPADQTVIDAAVGRGPVRIVSEGMGTCCIESCGVRNLWKIQYFGSAPAKRMTLNMLSVCDIPEEALASPEDLEDSKKRLTEVIRWIEESWQLTELR